MLLTQLATLIVTLVLLGIGFLAYQGWRDWGRHRSDPTKRWWWRTLTFIALALVSLAALMFVGYGVHNAMIGGDQGGNAMTVLLIKTGNSLSFLGVIIGFVGTGRGRWAAVAGGCLTLFLWFWQGMSL